MSPRRRNSAWPLERERSADRALGFEPVEEAVVAAELHRDGVLAEGALDVAERAVEHLAAVRDEEDVVAELLDLLHPVAREEDRPALLAQFEDDVFEERRR